ncbi:MAG: hypothetical protein HPY75_12460 [Actinobacteria bacterium]|nr:hypothetical protein [Actinomycetota bacterium]
METGECYENYPWWAVALCNLVSQAIYGLGAFIVYQLGWIWMAIYLVYLLVLEIRLLGGHCVHCYYYGKACAFGKGRLSALFFKRGDPGRFSGKRITWLSMIPDILVGLVPIIAGIIVLVRGFSWTVLVAMISVLLLATAGSGAVRNSLACRHCRQRELGCPAEQLFRKAGSQES